MKTVQTVLNPPRQNEIHNKTARVGQLPVRTLPTETDRQMNRQRKTPISPSVRRVQMKRQTMQMQVPVVAVVVTRMDRVPCLMQLLPLMRVIM
jgi:hypothetical protein